MSHMGKQKLNREGALSVVLSINESIVDKRVNSRPIDSFCILPNYDNNKICCHFSRMIIQPLQIHIRGCFFGQLANVCWIVCIHQYLTSLTACDERSGEFLNVSHCTTKKK